MFKTVLKHLRITTYTDVCQRNEERTRRLPRAYRNLYLRLRAYDHTPDAIRCSVTAF